MTRLLALSASCMLDAPLSADPASTWEDPEACSPRQLGTQSPSGNAGRCWSESCSMQGVEWV